MKRKIIILGAIIVVLAGVFLFYFFYLQNPDRQVLAQVNREKITLKQFNKELEKVESPLKEMLREDPQQLLEGIIMNRVFLQEAKKQGLTPPIKTYKDTDKDGLSPEEALIGELMKKKFSTPPTVTKEEIKTFYPLLKDRLGGKPLDQVSPIIEQFIRELKQQEEMKQYVTELRASAKVEMDQILLQKIASKPPESNTEEDLKKAFAGGKPFLVDFGANSCLPCRQLRPILKEIGKEYAGKAAILVIDVYNYQHLAKEYKIAALPTLVFFDNKGKEVFRHPGVMNKDQIVAKLKEIGAGS
ncbi:MAG: thioredoxin domain-containing protein [Thermodesulfobacteriota bacterium]|nr:thioredoxin domain-containing protein [Thermodesulfobacteriota bacterium]